jgi:hypothetical protein
MNTAHVRTEDTISTRNGFTGDFAEFVMPLTPAQRVWGYWFLASC